ncbi:MAG: hypothetical protein Q7S27_03385 [Nanoarchaeota archaeon]|nr:hypothetical protein [Nanoarchaeota archaeon]
MKESIDIYYDEEGDYLEISFGAPPEKEYTEHLDSEILVTRDDNTNEVKSIAITSFKKRSYILKEILKKFNLSIPFDVSFPEL